MPVVVAEIMVLPVVVAVPQWVRQPLAAVARVETESVLSLPIFEAAQGD
jgi:hypothetical protein